MDIDNILSICENHVQTVKKLKDQKSILCKEHSDIDKEVSDIYHYIEFICETDDQLLKASKLLKSTLERRRQIKNTLCLIGKFLEKAPKNIKDDTFHHDLKYSPRILKELFKQS
jgi:uncharacterized protein YktB (UPF0637 family)